MKKTTGTLHVGRENSVRIEFEKTDAGFSVSVVPAAPGTKPVELSVNVRGRIWTKRTPLSGSGDWSMSSGLPIRTLGELIQEGRKMKHCVATRAESAITGEAYYCSVQVHGQPFTVELQRDNFGISILEARGHCNALPDDEQNKALCMWISALNRLHFELTISPIQESWEFE